MQIDSPILYEYLSLALWFKMSLDQAKLIGSVGFLKYPLKNVDPNMKLFLKNNKPQ